MKSHAEGRLAAAVAVTLCDVVDGADITGRVEASRDLRIAMESFIGDAIRSQHTAWASESLDGVYPVLAVKMAPRTLFLAGTCCLISDQTITTFQMTVGLSAGGGEITTFDVRIGEPGEGRLGIARVPYGTGASSNLWLLLKCRLDEVKWVYRATRVQDHGDSGRVPGARSDWFDGYIEQLRQSKHEDPADGVLFACPCCRCRTLGERGGFSICPVCFWEDDGQDDDDSRDVRGGPNGRLSLEQARTNYAAFGACEESAKPFVRRPKPEEAA